MRYTFPILLLICFMCFHCQQQPTTAAMPDHTKKPAFAIAIHGGAGAIRRENMSPEKDEAYRAALDTALRIGETVLRNGGSAMDAVTGCISWLEDCPLFNAGKGAVFTHDGRNELDASIMDGSNQMAGAVGGVTTVRHPILLARAVMEKSPHVFLSGRGAEQFAGEQGLEIVDPAYFYTQDRWDALQKLLKDEKDPAPKSGMHRVPPHSPDYKFGTVGCVALDKNGNLAAGTSTGGMTNKRWNRIGDTPVIGAGTYASNDACAVSCTGHGEYFIRYAVAYDIYALMSYKGLSLQEATNEVVHNKLVEKGGEGGLIAVDKDGNIALPFNSAGMYRAWATPDKRSVAIYQE
ncbi:MAG: isoaspartyl peptidase/L-asparaginase [Lewinellaceae bacterium]|nr:isoaspartyl peptidase/L-asparaginase [Lewinellaceae bacterium]